MLCLRMTVPSVARRGFTAALISSACLVLPLVANAQTSTKTDTLNVSKAVLPSEGLNFNLTTRSDFDLQTGVSFDSSLDAVRSTLFKLDLTAPECATNPDACLYRGAQMDLGLTDTFRHRSERGLDLSLTPRASMRFNDEISSTAVGAVIEIGEDLREGSEFKSNTWYFFAGADAEALTYTPGSLGRITSGEFHLQDRIIVGDAQAGLGYRIGDADLSLSYMRREASTEDYSYKEDAATLSFTWKR